MSSPWSPVVSVGPPRGQAGPPIVFSCQSLQISKSWGVSPAQAILTYVGNNAPVTAGAEMTIFSGGHEFHGVCQQDTGDNSSAGRLRTLEFLDSRIYLDWDVVMCAFNQPASWFENGERVRGYKHLYPEDYDGWNWTYTVGPLTASEILEEMFEAPTVLTDWARVFHPDQVSFPVFDINCIGGKKLGAAIQDVSDKQGLVVGLVGGPFRLVWVRKGEGLVPTFPSNSDNQRGAISISGNPTRVIVTGDRNLYQVMNVAMVPDWSPAWEEFVIFELFADDIYQRASDPKTGARYNSMTGDPEHYVGRQLANARALTMTVREYAALRNDTSFQDFRKFSGRSRMDMPCALYIRTILFRAFRPDLTAFQNWVGNGVTQLDIEDRLLARVTHDPATGTMTASPGVPAEGNGYAIVKGYKVGSDLFRNIAPEQFNENFFSAAESYWQNVPFQTDDGGDGDRFVIFDEPVIVSEDLIKKVDGHSVINADFTLLVPQVKAALTFAAERYTYYGGFAGRDHVENVPGLHGEFVVGFNGLTEVLYGDGDGVDNKAGDIAESLLLRQFYYAGGGYTVRGSNATQLTGVIDRVTLTASDKGVLEVVDFTTERGRDYFEPERNLDRATREDNLLPGQAELQREADAARLIATGFKHNPQLTRDLSSLLFGTIESGSPLQTVYIKNGSAAKLKAGTPLKKASLTVPATGANTNTLAVMPTSATANDKIFVGLVARENELSSGPVSAQSSGIALARVKGPINENDPVGLGSGTEDYLISGGVAVGVAHQKIADSSIKLIPVRIGAGGGGGGLPVWLP